MLERLVRGGGAAHRRPRPRAARGDVVRADARRRRGTPGAVVLDARHALHEPQLVAEEPRQEYSRRMCSRAASPNASRRLSSPRSSTIRAAHSWTTRGLIACPLPRRRPRHPTVRQGWELPPSGRTGGVRVSRGAPSGPPKRPFTCPIESLKSEGIMQIQEV